MSDLLIVESTLISEGLEGMDAIRAFLRLEDERGTIAPQVVVDGMGKLVTDDGYLDSAVSVAPNGTDLAFCRQPIVEQLGHIDGTEWVRMHDLSMAFKVGSMYTVDPHVDASLYYGSPEPLPQPVLFGAFDADWSHDGRTIAVSEMLPGSSGAPDMTTSIIWEFDTETQERRTIASFPEGNYPATIRYSPDDRWLLVNDWMRGHVGLVECVTGAAITLPLDSSGVDWSPSHGALTLVWIERVSGHACNVNTFDLATWQGETLGRVETPGDLVDFREIDVHPDGTKILAAAPVGASAAIQREVRGGVYATAVLDLADFKYTAVLPAQYRSPAAQRRHSKPRWRVPRSVGSEIRLPDEKLASLLVPTTSGVSPELSVRRIARIRELYEAIGEAWGTDRLEPTKLREEYVALALSLEKEVPGEPKRAAALLRDVVGTGALQSRLEQLQGGDPVQSIVESSESSALPSAPQPASPPIKKRGLLSRMFGGEPRSLQDTQEYTTSSPMPPPAIDTRLSGILLRMITAETDTESYGFATDLKKILPPGDVWEYLARAQPNSQPIEAARVALTCFNWVVYQTDQFPFLLTALQAPQEMVEITLMRRGFSACLRLPDDELLVAPGFSVDEVMGRCSYRLRQLEKE